MEFTSEKIAKLIGGVCTEPGILITNVSSLAKAKKNSVCFYNDSKYKNDLSKTKAGIVIIEKSNESLTRIPKILVNDPYLAYAKVSNLFTKKQKKSIIHKSLVFGTDFKIGTNPKIDPYVAVGDNVSIGDNVHISSNVTIGSNVTISSNVTIGSNVTIADGVYIGKNCFFYAGCKIGTDGFGYAQEKDKSWVRIPQTGSVVIGDDVDIGANTTIDRGALDNTIIENGVKIDNQVQIAHNCIIGRNTIIAGCVGIAGSTVIGKNCMIGGGAMIKGHIKIADDTIISGGTGIGKTISVPGERYTNVFPYNLKHKDWLKIAAKLKNWIKNDK
jgi:UDP-3-O-[3-hydroxymyristoyl] glucosamine N-acyltransferase